MFTPEAIDLCSRKVSAVSGDIRRALMIAKRGVELASERGLTTWGKRWGVRGSVSIGLIAEAAKEHAESYKMSVGACGPCEA